MMTETTRNEPGFIQWLYQLAERGDRARLAALRRGLLLDPEQFYELYRVIPTSLLDAGRREVERRIMVAILFATHPVIFSATEREQRRRNLGDSLRRLALKQSDGRIDPEEGPPEPLKRRLAAVLEADIADLFGHLRHLVRLLKSQEIPVDWAQLLWDLRRWESADRVVQWNWSQAFYVGVPTAALNEDRDTQSGGEIDVH